MDENWWSFSKSRKTGINTRETQVRQYSKIQKFTVSILMTKIPKKFQNYTRRKPERLMTAVMFCKRSPKVITKVIAESQFLSKKTSKLIYQWKVEPNESRRKLVESSQSKYHEDHITSKGLLRCHSTIWCTTSFLCHMRRKFLMQNL